MMTIHKILVPTDFSDASISAYTHAQEIAKKCGARIDLIHIVPLMKYFSDSIDKLGVPINMNEDIYPHVKDGAEHRLKALLDDYFPEENKGNPIVLIQRKPSKAIAGYAEEHAYDLIVMAARGEHESELFRGGVAEQVIRYSTIPVLTVDNRLGADGFKRILVPTDASPVSFSALPTAITLAELYEGEITLFHVPELYGTLSDRVPFNPGGVTIESSIYKTILESLNTYLRQEGLAGQVSIKRAGESYSDRLVLGRGTSEVTIPLHTVLKRGFSAHYGIEKYAPEHADIIVMTTHGYRGLRHLILGSTAEMVALNVEMPVLAVKPAGHLLNVVE